MRLARKLTAVMVLGILVVFLVRGWHRVHVEIDRSREGLSERHRLTGRTVRALVVRLWGQQGQSSALAVVNQLSMASGRLVVRWIPAMQAAEHAPPGLVAKDVALLPDGGKSVVAAEDGKEHLFTYLPLALEGQLQGLLQISEDIEDHAQALRSTLENVLVATGIAAVVSMVLATLAGIFLVGRPMTRLIEKARRMGAGDLSSPLTALPRDELGELATELNRMCERLAEAQTRVGAEMNARIKMVEQLRHADRLSTVGQLAAGIAHELGTPLNVIAGRTEMIQTGEAQGPKVDECLIAINTQVERMTKIIRQLLEFARGGRLHRQRGDAEQVIRRSIAMLEPLARKSGVGFSVTGDHPPLSCDMDAGQVEQVLANLMLNAIQAMPGGGRISIAVRERRTRPPATPAAIDDDYLCISVQDQGVGMPPEQLPRIFEPFFTTKGVGEGTGLGLSVSYGIIAEHGGWIDVASQPGQGSTFFVYLPRRPSSQDLGTRAA